MYRKCMCNIYCWLLLARFMARAKGLEDIEVFIGKRRIFVWGEKKLTWISSQYTHKHSKHNGSWFAIYGGVDCIERKSKNKPVFCTEDIKIYTYGLLTTVNRHSQLSPSYYYFLFALRP